MKIALIGAGNVATHLGMALRGTTHRVVQTYSRTEAAAAALAAQLGCAYTTCLDDVTPTADLYLLSVKDDALPGVARALLADAVRQQALFVHTAGSVPLQLLSEAGAERCGVFYPMQTFSKQRAVCFSRVPCFVEAARADDLAVLRQLAADLGAPCHPLDSPHRRYLHLAAVFACNFANHCYAMAQEMTDAAGLPFDILLPLIDETAAKVHQLSPVAAQTGPAVRYDRRVMAAQQQLLTGAADHLTAIYQTMSAGIHRTALTQQTKNGENHDTLRPDKNQSPGF